MEKKVCVAQGIFQSFDFNIKTLFSSDLRHFENLKETNFEHDSGRVEIFNGKLMAIAGGETRYVELMRKNGKWKSITTVGNINGKLSFFSSLTIPGHPSDTLFVFGIHFLTFFILNNLN